MTKKQLFELIGKIDDRYIASAKFPKRKSHTIKHRFTKITVIAACVCLVIATATVAIAISSPKLVEHNGKEYILLKAYLTQLDYQVSMSSQSISSLPNGEEGTEFKYYIKKNGDVCGILSIAIYGNRIASYVCDVDFTEILKNTDIESFIYMHDTFYIDRSVLIIQ